MKEHPTLEELALWAKDYEAPERSPRVGRHVSTCGQCQQITEQLGHLARMTQEVTQAEPKRDVIERATEILADSGRSFQEAELIADTTKLATVRGDEGDGRILTYRADPCDLYVQILRWGDGRRSTLLGQVHASGDTALANAVVRVVGDDSVLAEISTDDLGEFHVALRLHLPFHFEVESEHVRFRTPLIRHWTPN